MTENLIAEFIGILVSGIIGFYIGKFYKVKQFYSAILPVVKKLRTLKDKYNISAEDTRDYVKTISSSFSNEFLGKKHAPKITKMAYRDIDEEKTCQICSLPAKLNGQDGCINCKLDCCAWDFENTNVK